MPFPQTHPALAQALEARGYAEPTPVQAEVLQPGAEARDLLVSAQTGSGKTVAYGLAFAASLLGGEDRLPRAGKPLALIVAPTRELAMQVQRELSWLYERTGARLVTCIGGTDGRAEARALAAGCHIVVGTPGRLCDHLDRNRLNLSDLRVVVLDEADEMLDLGFRDELETLLAATPETRRTLLFSATIARPIASLARQYQTDALRIDTLVRNQPHADIEYRAVEVANHERDAAVVNTLRYFEAPTAIVFCATRDGVRQLHEKLVERGFRSVALSGELSQTERTRALHQLRTGSARVCVATDVAARGLDLQDLTLVIHADLPMDAATLLHRSGRTGRAGRKGRCVVVVPQSRARRAGQLLSAAGVDARWSGPPTAELVQAQDSERLLNDAVLTEPADDALLEQARTLLDGRSPEQVAAALIRLHGAGLPQVDDLTIRPARADRRTEHSGVADSQPNGAAGESNWFRMNLGRQQKADPKWLVPLICRLGGLKKRDIGAIRIGDEDTHFEIRPGAPTQFSDAPVRDGVGEVWIEAAEGAPPAQPGRKPAPARRQNPSSRKRRIAQAA